MSEEIALDAVALTDLRSAAFVRLFSTSACSRASASALAAAVAAALAATASSAAPLLEPPLDPAARPLFRLRSLFHPESALSLCHCPTADLP